MLLSFSVPSMLPMIRAGLRQRAGQDVGGARVKRQTLRRIGPRAEKLLEFDPDGHTLPHDLHLWWKSRTPQREFLGKIDSGAQIFPLAITHDRATGTARTSIYSMTGPEGWRQGAHNLFWQPGDCAGSDFEREALADGFETTRDFCDYFVPAMGQTFFAALFRW